MAVVKNTIQFTVEGIDKFSKVFRRMEKSIGMVALGLKKMSAATIKYSFIVAGAGAAVGTFVNSIGKSIDIQAKFSDRIGIAIEQLTTYQFVAGQAGLSTLQFNLSVQRMTRRVAEAAAGTGEAKDALKEMRINAAEFKELPLDKQLELLADRFGEMKSSSDKLRLAFKLFDSEGTAVLQMLNQGSKQMRKMAEDAQFLGLTVSKQAAANTEKFTESMGRLGGSIRGVGRAIFNELAPVLTGLGNRMADTMARNRQSVADFVQKSILWMFILGDIISQVFQRIKEIFKGNQAALKDLFEGMWDFVKGVAKLFFNLGRIMFVSVVEGIKAIVKVVASATVWVGRKIKSIFTREDIPTFAETMAKTFSDAMKNAMDNFERDTKGVWAGVKEGGKETAESVGKMFGVNMAKAVANGQKALAKYQEFGKVVDKTNSDSITAARKKSEDELTEFEKFVKELNERKEEFTRSFFELSRATIQSLSDAVGAAIIDGEKMSVLLKNVVKDVLKSVIAMYVKLGIQRLILSKISTATAAKESASSAAKAVGLAGANGVASMAGAPFPINLTAPAFGAAMQTVAATQFKTGGAVGSALGAALGGLSKDAGSAGSGKGGLFDFVTKGVFHSGITNVPREGSFLLDKGERVLSASQNKDFTDFIGRSPGKQGGVVIESVQIHILENATNAEALLNMSTVEMEELVGGPILRAINNLDKRGIRPLFAERRSF